MSATISIKEDDWVLTGEWMWENRKHYNGLSVLPYDGGSYVQPPFEDSNEETFNKMMSTLKNVDLTKIIETQDNTNLSGEIACGADGCEII